MEPSLSSMKVQFLELRLVRTQPWAVTLVCGEVAWMRWCMEVWRGEISCGSRVIRGRGRVI